ncbi:MAG: SCO family protein [Nocardioidaceae bacterium]
MVRFTIRSLAVATLLAAALSSCGGGSDETASLPESGRLAGGTLVDIPLTSDQLDAELTTADGSTMTLGDLHGTTVVLTDFLTRCREICPLTSVDMNAVARAVDEAGLDDVVVLEGTVDPEGDDPARLAAYQALFGSTDSWTLFTAGDGTDDFWKSFGVAYERVDAEEPYGTDWQTGEPVTYDYEHTDAVIVIDADGHERWVIQGDPNVEGAAAPDPLASYLNDEGHEHLTDPAPEAWSASDVEQALTEITGHQIG